MSKNQIFRVLLFGGLAIGGIIFIQSYWVINSWYLRNSEFDEKVSIALRRVAVKMADQSDTELPKEGLINRLTTNSYIVNYNNFIDPHILEDFLLIEMDAIEPGLEFEYALYDCFTEELVYGNCCNVNDDDRESVNRNIIELADYTYFFIVRFPTRRSFLIGQVWIFIVFSLFSIVAVIAFLLAIRTIFRQKRLSELQKDFVNNMTHEFKTPLSSIKLSAMVLEGAPEVRDNDRLSNYARIISGQSKRLSDQIESVLDIVSSEKKFELNLEEIQLIDFLKNAIEIESFRFEKQALKIKSEFMTKDCLILADKYHLSNVISNIVENAVKYSVKEDDRDSRGVDLEIRLKSNESNYFLSFTDQGIGIEEKHQKYIFDKFFRVPTGNIHNVKGFGLGLYYVRNICELQGWKIGLKSTQGQGSTFTITIPKNDPV
jgi:two-component system phosphate regulon sensor histidine kinase PhoR